MVSIGAPSDPSNVEHQYDDVVDRVRAADVDDKVRELRLPLLVMHSPSDETVPIANASELFFAARIISAWVDQYLD